MNKFILAAQINTSVTVFPEYFNVTANQKKHTGWIEVPTLEKDVFAFAVRSKEVIDISYRTI